MVVLVVWINWFGRFDRFEPVGLPDFCLLFTLTTSVVLPNPAMRQTQFGCQKAKIDAGQHGILGVKNEENECFGNDAQIRDQNENGNIAVAVFLSLKRTVGSQGPHKAASIMQSKKLATPFFKMLLPCVACCLFVLC